MLKSSTISKNIDQGANQCVKCGLCLPHCPTYQVARNENESPRGRIALMQGVIKGQVPISKKLIYHLDTCLACRACEAVCPAKVPYETLITSSLALLENKKSWYSRCVNKLLMWIFQNPTWVKILGFFSSLGKNVSQNVMPVPSRSTKNKILLLPSCANSVFDQQLAIDAKKILMHLGFEVKIPEKTYCCGALALHAGELKSAIKCAQQYISQWHDIDYIVTLTNGCHATMQDYAREPIHLKTPQIPLLTIETFLLQEFKSAMFTMPASLQHFILHTPCSLRNAIRQPDISLQLLQKIPNITCTSIPVSVSGCCGAAGSYFLRHPDIAKQLIEPIQEFAKSHTAQALLTTNIGCALHIQHSFKRIGIDLPILHPVTVLANLIKSL